jgi:hypothetical protein
MKTPNFTDSFKLLVCFSAELSSLLNILTITLVSIFFSGLYWTALKTFLCGLPK